jgi:hypothetical protein
MLVRCTCPQGNYAKPLPFAAVPYKDQHLAAQGMIRNRKRQEKGEASQPQLGAQKWCGGVLQDEHQH